MVRASWELDRNGKATGEMVGFDEQSLYRVAEQDMALYEEAAGALVAPPYRWREWVSVFHPREGSYQIVGYRRLRPKDWFTRNDETDELQGPFDMKRRAYPGKTKKLSPGVYAVGDLIIFTRDRAEAVGLTQEALI